MVVEIKLNKGKADLSLLNESIGLSVISDKIITSVEITSVIDVVYSKLPIKAKVISFDNMTNKDIITGYEYMVSIDLNLDDLKKTNPDVLLNIGTVNFKFIQEDKEEIKILILQIVKEGNSFYKHLIS